ncbi:hypothetical protein tinsulaeT_32580 [Thalassotalea insulae]|uniref:Uncharacterized protein n=1 Tax=Thalassotalea insulae TaxID=2056778 RepID=A0ABQ6GVI1_9GAMM|nr:hypothetical protein [Thalassotalea insulae]GLX79918.1 hypothetical protein tinsulaeT_32580 [Thalassotalea insulae]
MKKTSLIQDENLSFKISYQLLPQEYQCLDLYFSIPDEMGISASTLSEESYFYSSIKAHCAYYSDQIHLPLVHSRFISKQKGEQSDYRSNLNLFSYQLRMALDADLKQTLQNESTDDFYQSATELAEQTQNLLKKLRRYTPSDPKLSSYFDNVDNYLSWYVEQSFLNLLANGPKSSEKSEQRESLFELCRQENAYRIEHEYNSQVTLDDPNRITNKMRLLQRLSEYGVVFQKKTYHLNINLKRVVRGTVTAVIMAFVMTIILNARSAFTEVSVVLIALLGFIYGLRETFKEDITRIIWRKIQRGRAKWQHIFSNSVTHTKICSQTIWLEYIRKKHLPKNVSQQLQKRRQQNKQAAQLLHFRCVSKVLSKEFLPGYDEIQNQILFNLTPFVRYLKKGEGRLYSLDGSKISNQGVERRYQMTLVLVQSNKKSEEYIQRFKITINRSKIINIEPMKAVQNFDLNKDA